MGDFSQLSMPQREIVYEIYTKIGVKPFKVSDYPEVFTHHMNSMIIGLKVKGALKKAGKRNKYEGTTWILTTIGVREALRYERIMS